MMETKFLTLKLEVTDKQEDWDEPLVLDEGLRHPSELTNLTSYGYFG